MRRSHHFVSAGSLECLKLLFMSIMYYFKGIQTEKLFSSSIYSYKVDICLKLHICILDDVVLYSALSIVRFICTLYDFFCKISQLDFIIYLFTPFFCLCNHLTVLFIFFFYICHVNYPLVFQ